MPRGTPTTRAMATANSTTCRATPAPAHGADAHVPPQSVRATPVGRTGGGKGGILQATVGIREPTTGNEQGHHHRQQTVDGHHHHPHPGETGREGGQGAAEPAPHQGQAVGAIHPLGLASRNPRHWFNRGNCGNPGETVPHLPMVDRSQALKHTLSLPRQAGVVRPGRCTPGAAPTPATTTVPGPPAPRLPKRPCRPRRCPGNTGSALWRQGASPWVELLIAVVIIGVLSGVALPAFLGQQNKAKVNAANVQARGLMSYCLAHFIDNGKMPDSNDNEYKRLSKDSGHSIIIWEATSSNSNPSSGGNQPSGNKCEVKIKGKGITLNPDGNFSIDASGDATKIQATPAKVQR